MSDPKNVVIAQKNLRDKTSGASRKVHEEIKYFSRLGHTVYVLSEVIDKTLVRQSGGIPVKTLRWSLSDSFKRTFYRWQCERAIKKYNADFVIGHGDIFHQDVFYIHGCRHLAHELLYGKPIDPNDPVAKMHQTIFEKGTFKVLVCNANMMKKDFHQRFNIPLEKMVVIHPEIDMDKFDPEGKEQHRHIQRDKFRVESSEVLIGLITSGNFKLRNVDLLLEATKILKETTLSPFKILIAGKNKDPRFAAKAVSLGIQDQIIFAPSINAVEQYYYAIDIFVLPAFCEAFGRSVTEAMRCGNPVIVSPHVGCGEILEGESRDFILNQLSAQELAGKLKILMENPEKRAALGALNQKTVRGISADEQNKKLGELLKERDLLL